jgi:hypothetical protein
MGFSFPLTFPLSPRGRGGREPFYAAFTFSLMYLIISSVEVPG